MAVLTDLEWELRNISDNEESFQFLPPHGATLASGESWTYVGDLVAEIRRSGGQRRVDAFEAMLNTKLAIVRSPRPHLYDDTLDETKVVDLHNGTLRVLDPSWGAYSSSIAGL
jgi:hypothetical protein